MKTRRWFFVAILIGLFVPIVGSAVENHRWVVQEDLSKGRVKDLALDMANPNVLYACGPGGLYRTTDGAKTWLPVKLPHRKWTPIFSVDEVAVHGGTLYVKPSGVFGILKSLDGGASWTQIADDHSVSYLVIDPDNPTTLYAIKNESGILKSTDSGTTWEMLDPVDSECLRMCPDNSQVLWWCFLQKAVFESSDKGTTWKLAQNTIPGLSFKETNLTMEDPDTWCLQFDWQGKWTFKGTKSRFGNAVETSGRKGLQITSTSISQKCVRLTVSKMGEKGSGYWRSSSVRFTRDGGKTIHTVDNVRMTTLRSDPKDPELFYAATGEKNSTYFFSGDGGKTWELLYAPQEDFLQQESETMALVERLFSPSIRAKVGKQIITDPSDNQILYAVGKHPGVLKSTDGGHTWSNVGHDVRMNGVFRIACHPTKPKTVYALGSRNVYCISETSKHMSGNRWDLLQNADEAHALRPHPADTGIFIACIKNKAWIGRRDAGDSIDWCEISHQLPGTPVGCLFDPNNADRFYLLTTEGLTETVDSGKTWSRRKVASPEVCKGFRRVYQTSSKRIYTVSDENTLLRSTDLGATWNATNLPTKDIRMADGAVQVHPTQPSNVLVVTSQGDMFHSTDAGKTWRQLTVEPDIRCAAFDPNNPSTFYVASTVVYRTVDGGDTFEKFDNDLPDWAINELVVSPADGTVYAATDGAGIYRLEIETPRSTGNAAQ